MLTLIIACHPVLNLWTPGFWIPFICPMSNLFALQTDLLVWRFFFIWASNKLLWPELYFICGFKPASRCYANFCPPSEYILKKYECETLNCDGETAELEHLQNVAGVVGNLIWSKEGHLVNQWQSHGHPGCTHQPEHCCRQSVTPSQQWSAGASSTI